MTWAVARSCVPWFQGQFDGEAGAVSGLAVDADTSLMGVDQLADDGEAEADAGGFAAQFTAATDEGFEDAPVIGGGDAGAVILDTDDGQAG